MIIRTAGPRNQPDPLLHSQMAFDSTAIPPPLSPVDAGAGAADADAGAATDSGTGVPASAKTLVVMRGPSPLSLWSFNDASRTITVVGQLGATIAPGATIGIHISGGTVYIRSLRVSGGRAQTQPLLLTAAPCTWIARSSTQT